MKEIAKLLHHSLEEAVVRMLSLLSQLWPRSLKTLDVHVFSSDPYFEFER